MAFGHTYNPGNVKTSVGFKQVPEGDYDVIIEKSEEGISKSSGKDLIKLELVILNGEYKGCKLFYYILDDQYADQRIFDVLTSCRRAIPTQVTSATFRGSLCGRVRVKVDTYNGEKMSSVKYWLRPAKDSGQVTSIPDEKSKKSDDIPF